MPNRSPITDSIKRVNDAIAYLQNTLNPGEIDLLLDELAPLPEPEPEVKRAKTRKKSSTSKSSQSSSKSPRASGMEAQLKERRQEQREPMTTKDDDYDPEAERCTFVRGDRKVCYLLSDHNVHHMKTHPEYHEFESGKSAAPPAPALSSANDGVGSTTANSGTGKVGAGTVAHGASGGN